MHQQIRLSTAKSPPDLEAVLRVLADAGLNIRAVGGSGVEQGGELGLAVSHEDHAEAMRVLREAGYRPREVEVAVCLLDPETPGQLLACVRDVAKANKGKGHAIMDLAIGIPEPDGRIPVQVFSSRRGPG